MPSFASVLPGDEGRMGEQNDSIALCLHPSRSSHCPALPLSSSSAAFPIGAQSPVEVLLCPLTAIYYGDALSAF